LRFDGYQYDARYKIKQGLKYAGRQMEKQQSAERKETSAGLFCVFLHHQQSIPRRAPQLLVQSDLAYDNEVCCNRGKGPGGG